MAGYQGGADATVIAAAKAAATVPKGYHATAWDYEGYIEGIANLAKFIVGKAGAANERMSTISGIEEELEEGAIKKANWGINNTDYFQNGNVQMKEWSNIMATTLPFTKVHKDAKRNYDNKIASYQKILEDEALVEQWLKNVNSATGPDRSTYNDPMVENLVTTIQLYPDQFHKYIRFTDDGIVAIGKDGNEVPVEELPGIALKTDGKETSDFIMGQVTNGIKLKLEGNWSDWNEDIIRSNISGHFDAQTINGLGSAAFDYEFSTKDGRMSFSDYLIKTSGELQEAYEKMDREGKLVGLSTDELKKTKSMLAKNLWHNDSQMKDEFLDWVMDDVLDNQIGGTKVKPVGGGTDYKEKEEDFVPLPKGKSSQIHGKGEGWTSNDTLNNIGEDIYDRKPIKLDDITFTWDDDKETYVDSDGEVVPDKSALFATIFKGEIDDTYKHTDFYKSIPDWGGESGGGTISGTDRGTIKNQFSKENDEASAVSVINSILDKYGTDKRVSSKSGAFGDWEYNKIYFDGESYYIDNEDDYDELIKAIEKEVKGEIDIDEI